MSARGLQTSTLVIFSIYVAALVSLLLPCVQCLLDCSNAIEASQGPGVSLRITNCTKNLLNVTYRKLNTTFGSNVVTVKYTCELLHNGTKVVDDEVLIEDSSFPMSTRTVTELNLEHGTMCRFYGCYEFGSYFEGFSVYNIKTATCTVADIEKCHQECQNWGANGCRTEGVDGTHLGYECVCDGGYVWNGTHCENVDECNTTEPEHQHNCTLLPGSWCVDSVGSFDCVQCAAEEEWNGTACVQCAAEEEWNGTACVQCTAEEEWNGTTCLPILSGTSITTEIVPTISTTTTTSIIPFTTLPATVLAPTSAAAVETSKLPSSGTVGIAITLSLLTLIGAVAILTFSLVCVYQRTKTAKSVHGDTSYYFGYPYFYGYGDQELDMNFEPIKSIHPCGVQHLPVSPHHSLSITSDLNYLWEDNSTLTALTKFQLNIAPQRPSHHSDSSESDSRSLEHLDSNPQPHGNDTSTNDVFADIVTPDGGRGTTSASTLSSTLSPVRGLNCELDSGFDNGCSCGELHTATSSSDCADTDGRFTLPCSSTRHWSTRCHCRSSRESSTGERTESGQIHDHSLDIYGSGFTDQDSTGYITFGGTETIKSV